LCGAIRYRVNGEPLTVYACHCTECQRRTGSAFAISMLVPRVALEVLAGEPSGYAALLADGRSKAGRLCAQCGTRLWGEPKNPAIVVIQPGTLEQPCGLEPVAHQWTREAQPWLVLPEGVVKFERQPEVAEMIGLWKARSRAGGR
jgi:hypothetical protein